MVEDLHARELRPPFALDPQQPAELRLGKGRMRPQRHEYIEPAHDRR